MNKIFIIVICIFLALLALHLFQLENNMFHRLEYNSSDKNPFRISTEKFHINPYSELKRYINDTVFFANIWRPVAILACVLCIMMYTLPLQENIFPIGWIVIFTVCYQVWNLKLHHHYKFVFRSVSEALEHLEKTKGLNTLTKKLLKRNPSYNQTGYDWRLKK